MKILRQTRGLCDKCLKEVPAKTFEHHGKIYIRKICPAHGKFTALHFWDDPEIYNELIKVKTADPKSANVSVCLTRKCNLDCMVCYARANEAKTPDFRVADLKVLRGYKRVLLTGGEPTIRKDLPRIIRTLRRNGKRVTIFSNGLKLAQIKYLRLLIKSGLNNVIMQLDSLEEKVSAAIRGKNLIGAKKQAVQNIQREKIPLYLYSVVLKNNPDNTREIIAFARKFPVLKMVSFNVLGMFGRCNKEDFVPSSQIIKNICVASKIDKKEWIEASKLFNTIDRLLLMKKKNRRLFSKCFMKCPVIFHRGKTVPVTKIFHIKKINDAVGAIPAGKGRRTAMLKLLPWFFYEEVLINFLKNYYFRVLLWKSIKNIKYLFWKERSLFNPFFFIAVTVVPSAQNIDFEFLKECNIHAVTPDNLQPEPACVRRVRTNS